MGRGSWVGCGLCMVHGDVVGPGGSWWVVVGRGGSWWVVVGRGGSWCAVVG